MIELTKCLDTRHRVRKESLIYKVNAHIKNSALYMPKMKIKEEA